MTAHASPASEYKVGVSITEVAEFEADFDFTSLFSEFRDFPFEYFPFL